MTKTVNAYHTLIFDLDGTLTDPKIGITRSIQHALKHLNVEVPETDELFWCIGPPLRLSFAQLVGPNRVDEAISLYRDRFATIGLFENTPYPGIHDILQHSQNANRRLIVASSKPQIFVDKILEHFELAQFFSQTFGSELDGTRSDKSELLEYAITRCQINTEAAIMIGDRKHDMIGANNNGLASIGVLYGYGSADELLAAGADKLAKTPAHLSELLA